MDAHIKKVYVPMTETGFYILLCLRTPNHGYGIVQKVKELTEDEVVLGPGTMYGSLSKMEKDGLIEFVREEEKRKIYQITDLGDQFSLFSYNINISNFLALEFCRRGIVLLCPAAFHSVRGIYEQLCFFAFHKGKVCQSRNQCQAAAAAAKYCCDLRNHSGSQCLFQVNGTKCLKSISCFLKTHTCTVNKTNYSRFLSLSEFI